MHRKNIVVSGKKIADAKNVLILLHGRGASAHDIFSLTEYFNLSEFALIAPQATNNTWYPYPFLSPPKQNEPWLSSALNVLGEIVSDIHQQNILSPNIYFLGFSQGACLMLEFITRNAKKYGGAITFTGGLIGDKIYTENYTGDFEGTKIFMGSSDIDPHVPVERVYATTNILKDMHADVTEKIYTNMGHTINEDEIQTANSLFFSSIKI